MPFSPEEAVLQRVPHRAPILRVHRIVAVDATHAVVQGSEPAGEGALPWACGAIEGLAQSAAVLLGHSMGKALEPGAEPPRGMLVAVKRFEVPGEPPAGAEITYHVRLVRRLGPTVMLSGHAEHGGVCLARGELTLWTSLPGSATRPHP